eukprot:576376-Amphidinium_carterae.1
MMIAQDVAVLLELFPVAHAECAGLGVPQATRRSNSLRSKLLHKKEMRVDSGRVAAPILHKSRQDVHQLCAAALAVLRLVFAAWFDYVRECKQRKSQGCVYTEGPQDE